jgi:hypothetical protein
MPRKRLLLLVPLLCVAAFLERDRLSPAYRWFMGSALTRSDRIAIASLATAVVAVVVALLVGVAMLRYQARESQRHDARVRQEAKNAASPHVEFDFVPGADISYFQYTNTGGAARQCVCVVRHGGYAYLFGPKDIPAGANSNSYPVKRRGVNTESLDQGRWHLAWASAWDTEGRWHRLRSNGSSRILQFDEGRMRAPQLVKQAQEDLDMYHVTGLRAQDEWFK